MCKSVLVPLIPLLAALLTACGSPPTPVRMPDTTLVGPSLAGIAQRGATRIDGLDARAYLYTSIMRPSNFLVAGFDNLMPSTLAKTLSGEEIDAVVAYLLAQE